MNRVNRILNNKLFKSYLKIINEYEKERIFCLHNIDHFLSVARIMTIQAMQDGISIEHDILYAVALLHDIGRAFEYQNGLDHSHAGALIAIEILDSCLYNSDEITIISSAILNHNNKEEKNYLHHLLRYADRLSRNCFLCSAKDKCNWPENKKNRGVVL